MLPICKTIELSTKTPKPPDYPYTVTTLAEAIKKKRIDMRLPKTEIARILGVRPDTIWNWEDRGKLPNAKPLKRIIEWLGYVPPLGVDPSTLGGQLFIYRAKKGYTQLDIAKALRITSWIVCNIENGKKVEPVYLRRVKEFLNTKNEFVV